MTVIKSMSKLELAKLYGVSSKTIARWITGNRDCFGEMKALGYNATSKMRLTPKLVRVIFRHYGDPRE